MTPPADLSALASALLDGDLGAAVPLMEWLREAGDSRHRDLRRLVGAMLAAIDTAHDRVAEQLEADGRDVAYYVDSDWLRFRAQIGSLFWDVLPGMAGRIRYAAELCREINKRDRSNDLPF